MHKSKRKHQCVPCAQTQASCQSMLIRQNRGDCWDDIEICAIALCVVQVSAWRLLLLFRAVWGAARYLLTDFVPLGTNDISR